MAKLTLAEMRAKLQEVEDRKSNKSSPTGDKAAYQFWNIPDNATATLRFLPDGNDDNSYFWVEKLSIKLPFSGVKGGDVSKPISITVPCMEQYGKSCPIQEEIKEWWKDESMVEDARTYYKKRAYLYQGFVVTNPIKEEDLPENPIRRFVINKSIHDKIKAALMDTEIEDMPTDFDNGLDFRLIKTRKGQYANYDTSSFARKARPLTEDELAAVEKYSLFDLKTFLPAEPDEKRLKKIFEMFEASVNNELFDPEKFSEFKPFGLNVGNSNASSSSDDTDEQETSVRTTSAVAKAPVREETEEVEEEIAPKKIPAKAADASVSDQPKKSPQDVLAMLRQRKAEKEGK